MTNYHYRGKILFCFEFGRPVRTGRGFDLHQSMNLLRRLALEELHDFHDGDHQDAQHDHHPCVALAVQRLGDGDAKQDVVSPHHGLADDGGLVAVLREQFGNVRLKAKISSRHTPAKAISFQAKPWEKSMS